LPENFDYGSIENNIYRNKYFGFEIKVPAKWSVIDKEMQSRDREQSKKLFGEKYKEMVEKMPEDVQNASLLAINKYPRDSVFDDTYNPSLAMVAENIRRVGDISASQYLDQTKKLMKQAGMDVDTPDAYGKTKIGGREFSVMPVTMRVQGYAVSQQYYVRIEKGFAFAIIVTYGYEAQQREIDEILATAKFE
ncbi:MAG TPA: hypothetical protein VHM26_01075, partial [Chitinophagaceae bacterium]|nr:hypothetical protein [Chitinophagaceae bacterium]